MRPFVAAQPSRQPCRLAAGGLIDRGRTLAFRFDGQEYLGHPGDTLASALLAGGVRLIARSFKYHRPRGTFSAGSEEPSGLVELRTGARREPNTKATTIELFDGLEAASQNCWPSLRFDALALNQLAAPLLGAGFYYKTFMWPAAFWERVYEPLIRRAAGLGRAAAAADPDAYDQATAFCDVLVIGAGPAGLMAALAAGRSGARVILADEGPLPGGRCLAERLRIGGEPCAAWAAVIARELAALPETRLLPRTTVFGVYDGGTYAALERVSDHLAVPLPGQPRQRLWRIVARRVVLAAGATERPIVFGDNDRPGVMLAGAVRSYLNRHGVAPGRRAVVFANNDDAAATVADLHAAGVAVAALVDTRAVAPVARRIADACGVPLLAGAAVVRAFGGSGGVSGAAVRLADGREQRIACDLIAVSGGWNPNAQLATHLGGRTRWDEARAALLPPEHLPPGMVVAGAAAGDFDVAACLASGAAAGRAAAGAAGFDAAPLAVPETPATSVAIAAYWQAPPSAGKAFVDLQNDVTAGDIALAHREGFGAAEHLKRYTTLGMATDQGRTSGVIGMALLAGLTGRGISATGTTSARPPYTPVAIGALAGRQRGRAFKPARLPPSHASASEQGAAFVETGLWLRPQYFPQPGESGWRETVAREVLAVRAAVGICDVSSLGKIDVQGADAAAFLDRLYINAMKSLPVGMARYGVMLREDGIVMDDGTVARLGAQHYFVTTTTANAAKVMQHMEFCRQWLWPELDVQLAAVTEQWAQYAVAGPRSRALLERIVDAAGDVSDAALPYMAARAAGICGGTPARLYRLSFSGERAYEIGVPARYGDALWRRLLAVGADLGVTPYGSEALGVMRIEKGHIGGPELNGTTTPADLGLGRMASTKKDYIGRVLGGRPGLTAPDRPALIGVRPIDGMTPLRSGAHFVAHGAPADATHDEGHVTSVAFSPTLGHPIGLGLLARGRQRHGEIIRACDPLRGGEVAVEVVPPVFVDPAGERLRG